MFDVPQLSEGYEWLAKRACVSVPHEKFFVDAGSIIDPDVLERCRRCPVRTECLLHAYSRGLNAGYFGGVSAGERKRLPLAVALEHIDADSAAAAAEDRANLPDPGDETGTAPAA